MTVRGLAWINCIGLLALAWLASVASRAPLSYADGFGRLAGVLLAGFVAIGACALLARRFPVASKILLTIPLLLIAVFIVGLVAAAVVGSL